MHNGTFATLGMQLPISHIIVSKSVGSWNSGSRYFSNSVTSCIRKLRGTMDVLLVLNGSWDLAAFTSTWDRAQLLSWLPLCTMVEMTSIMVHIALSRYFLGEGHILTYTPCIEGSNRGKKNSPFLCECPLGKL